MFLARIWIDKIYYSDDVLLTQIVLQRTKGVNSEEEDAKDEKGDKSYEDNITGKHKVISKNESVGMAEDLYDEERV